MLELRILDPPSSKLNPSYLTRQFSLCNIHWTSTYTSPNRCTLPRHFQPRSILPIVFLLGYLLRFSKKFSKNFSRVIMSYALLSAFSTGGFWAAFWNSAIETNDYFDGMHFICWHGLLIPNFFLIFMNKQLRRMDGQMLHGIAGIFAMCRWGWQMGWIVEQPDR